MTGAGISRSMADLGLTVTAETINRHKTHYAPAPERPKGTPKKDFAIIVRNKALEQFENEDLDLTNKDHAPGINAGLKAQALIDGREKQKSKQANAQLAFAIIQMLQGGVPDPLLLDDGNIEGEFAEVTDGEA